MTKKEHLLIFIFSITTAACFSQNTGTLVIYQKKIDELYIKVDSAIAPAFKEIPLQPGKHIVYLWSPTYSPIIDTITIEAGKYTHINADFGYTPAYRDYLRNKKESLAVLRFAAGITTCFAMSAVASNAVIYASKKKALKAKDKYDNAISAQDIEAYREEFYKALKTYENYTSIRSVTYIGLLGSAVIGGLTGYLYYKKHRAYYTPEKNPWLTSFAPSFDPVLHQFQVHLSVAIK